MGCGWLWLGLYRFMLFWVLKCFPVIYNFAARLVSTIQVFENGIVELKRWKVLEVLYDADKPLLEMCDEHDQTCVEGESATTQCCGQKAKKNRSIQARPTG